MPHKESVTLSPLGNLAMGRRKISIELIRDARSRQTTFLKRKTGLMKKAMELAVLCNCRIGLIIFDANGKLYDFKSEDMSSLVTNYFSQEVFESNDKDSLFRRYNTCKDKAKQDITSQDETTENHESGYEDGEKTDETVVDMECQSAFAADTNHKAPAPAPSKITKRKGIRSMHAAKRDGMSAQKGVTHGPSQACNGWSTFSAHPAYVSESVFTGGVDQQAMWDRHYKHEPYSASQQILRLEDSPPFLMSIPRQSSDATYGMSASSMMADMHQQQTAYPSTASAPNCPLYLLNNADGHKIMDACDNYKNPAMSSSLMSTARLSAAMTSGDIVGPSAFPYFDHLSDPRHLTSLQQQFSMDHGLSSNALGDVQQEAMLLQSRLCSNTAPFTFPSASHTPPS